jgi:hypothetical protein
MGIYWTENFKSELQYAIKTPQSIISVLLGAQYIFLRLLFSGMWRHVVW